MFWNIEHRITLHFLPSGTRLETRGHKPSTRVSRTETEYYVLYRQRVCTLYGIDWNIKFSQQNVEKKLERGPNVCPMTVESFPRSRHAPYKCFQQLGVQMASRLHNLSTWAKTLLAAGHTGHTVIQ
jgi:hypothetical protein